MGDEADPKPIKFSRNFYAADPVAGISDLVPAIDSNGRVLRDGANRIIYETKLTRPSWPDGSDIYANKNETFLSFQNIRNSQTVFFKSFITAFNESYTPDFNPTQVFGRTDPIYQYKGTTRNITLAWKMPAASESEAYENLGKVQRLVGMLYPNYTSTSNALTLSEAPLVRLKMMNMIQKLGSNISGSSTEDPNDIFNGYQSDSNPKGGLLGVITSCVVNHNLEGADGVFQKIGAPNTILPKLIDVNISFSPLHEKTLRGTDPHLYGALLSKDQKSNTFDFNENQGGMTLGRIRRLQRTAEETRRRASSAQQEVDSEQRALRKAQRALNRTRPREVGGVNVDQTNIAAQENLEARQQALDAAEREARIFNSGVEYYENQLDDLLRGS